MPHETLLEGPLVAAQVFETDTGGLLSADVILALLDGSQVDDGTACEIGIFSELLRTGAKQGGIVGLMTDIRMLRAAQNGGPQMNLFIRGCVERFGVLHTNIDEAIAAVESMAAHARPNDR